MSVLLNHLSHWLPPFHLEGKLSKSMWPVSLPSGSASPVHLAHLRPSCLNSGSDPSPIPYLHFKVSDLPPTQFSAKPWLAQSQGMLGWKWHRIWHLAGRIASILPNGIQSRAFWVLAMLKVKWGLYLHQGPEVLPSGQGSRQVLGREANLCPRRASEKSRHHKRTSWKSRQTQGMEKKFQPTCGEQRDKVEGGKKAGLWSWALGSKMNSGVWRQNLSCLSFCFLALGENLANIAYLVLHLTSFLSCYRWHWVLWNLLHYLMSRNSHNKDRRQMGDVLS